MTIPPTRAFARSRRGHRRSTPSETDWQRRLQIPGDRRICCFSLWNEITALIVSACGTSPALVPAQPSQLVEIEVTSRQDRRDARSGGQFHQPGEQRRDRCGGGAFDDEL